MKCDKCGSDMRWVGSMRDGHMNCQVCEYAEQLPVLEVGFDPAATGCQEDFPNAFYASQMIPDGDATQCKKCHASWVTERKNLFAICPSCGYAGWKEYV